MEWSFEHGANATVEDKRFIRAWSAARTVFDEFRPEAWTDVADSEEMLGLVLDAIWERRAKKNR